MHNPSLVFPAILATFLTTALAAPTVPSLNAMKEGPNIIVKRGEGVHLVDCVTYSAVVYCANDSDCNRNPGAGNQCVPEVRKWEGASRRCTFPATGTEFTWNIRGDAQSLANYAEVGKGNNGYHDFTIFKDDKHVMYTDGNGHACSSTYYCLP